MKMSVEQYIETRFTKLVEKFSIPKRLHDDVRQEIALAYVEAANGKYADRQTFEKWAIDNYVERRISTFLKKERYHLEHVSSIDAIQLRNDAEARFQAEQVLEITQSEMVSLLHSLFNDSEAHERYHQFISLVERGEWDTMPELIRLFCNENGDMSYERGRQIFAKMLRMCRHPSRSKPLRNYYEAFETIREAEYVDV